MNVQCGARIAILLLAAMDASAEGSRYEVTRIFVSDIGTLGGSQATAIDINDEGAIVGWSLVPGGRRHAFLYVAGRMQDIAAGFFDDHDSEACGINIDGEIVGNAQLPAASASTSFFRTPGGAVGLITGWPDDDIRESCSIYSSVNALNDYRLISGWSQVRPPGDGRCASQPVPMYWRDIFEPNDIYVGPAGGKLYDINNAGTIAGESWERGPFSFTYGFLWNDGWHVGIPLPSGASLGCIGGPALGINEAGHTVGFFSCGAAERRRQRAYFWDGSNQHSRDLGFLKGGTKSTAYEVNDQAFVVGTANRAITAPGTPVGTTVDAAFLWHEHVGLIELPMHPASSTHDVCEAFSVNNRNELGRMQAAGYCTVGKLRRAVRWDIATRLRAP